MITEKILFEDDYDQNSRTSSIGSNDPVVIINPTQYTLREDEVQEEYSIFQDIGPRRDDEEKKL